MNRYEVREISAHSDIWVGVVVADDSEHAMDALARRIGFDSYAEARDGPWQSVHFRLHRLLPDNSREPGAKVEIDPTQLAPVAVI